MIKKEAELLVRKITSYLRLTDRGYEYEDYAEGLIKLILEYVNFEKEVK